MTNNQLTDKRLAQLAKRNFCQTKGEEYTPFGDEVVSMAAELQERRKAAMDSKPVILYRQINPVNGMKTYWAELDPEEFRHLKQHTDENAELMTLYRHAQPAPVAQDERAAFNAWNNEDNLPIAGVSAKNAAWLAWQARASLCGNSVLDATPERPADSSNGDDVEAWFDEGWNACRAAMLQSLRTIKAAPALCSLSKTGEVLHTNSPVIPDGYVMVPMEPTGKQWAAGVQAFDSGMDKVIRIYKAMLAAAPQEVGDA